MEQVGQKFQIQGVDVTQICEQFGTPLYVYDGHKIKTQVENLKKAFSACDVKIKFAAKALTNISILKLIKKSGAGVDVVSTNEGRIALQAGFSPGEINYTPSGVGFDEIAEAVDMQLSVNLDNLPILEKFGKKYGSTVPCGLRLNPSIMAGGNLKISTGHSQSKFGIPIAQLSRIKELMEKYKIVIHGLHIHTGSEIIETEVFMKMADIFFGIAEDFPDLKFIDFGGGFKVAYKKGDKTTDIEGLGLKLGQAFTAFEKKLGRKLQLWIEPGKYIVSEAGYLFVKAMVVKENPELTFVGVNSGLNHLIRPMMYNSYHEIMNVSNPGAVQKKYTVVGNICETDTFGEARELSEVREGDLLVLLNAGAYGFSMASQYNSRPRPAEVLVLEGKAMLIRERDTMEDLLRGQIDVIG